MRKIALTLVPVLFLGACANAYDHPNQTMGTVIGAGAGGLIGSMFGGGAGKLVGVGLGTLVGAGIGNALGSQADDNYARQRAITVTPNSAPMNSGEQAAYNRGRAEYESRIQQQREMEAYRRGASGQ